LAARRNPFFLPKGKSAVYPTRVTCIRDYIHVSDLVQAHLEALRYLRSSGRSLTLNCGYGHGFSVREVLDTVKQVSHVDFQQMMQVGHIRLH
jgi:UDP-glucose 4-epimerase